MGSWSCTEFADFYNVQNGNCDTAAIRSSPNCDESCQDDDPPYIAVVCPVTCSPPAPVSTKLEPCKCGAMWRCCIVCLDGALACGDSELDSSCPLGGIAEVGARWLGRGFQLYFEQAPQNDTLHDGAV